MAATGVEIASAYVSLLVKMPGAARTMNAALGKVDIAPAAKRIGQQVADGVGKSLKSQVAQKFADATAAALDKSTAATKRMADAEHALVKARAQHGTASAKVTAAEEQLDKLRKAGKASTGDLQKAEAALAKAQADSAGTRRGVETATNAVTAAKRDSIKASDEYAAALKREKSSGEQALAWLPLANARVQEVATKWQDAGKKIGALGDSLTTYVTKPAIVAGGAVSTLIGALGFKRLVGIDTARGQFKGLGMDADAVMKQVDAGVTNTSLSMAQGASMAVGILATGAVPLRELEAQIKRVSNVSAAYNVDAEHANYLLNLVLTKQKVTWGDLSQIQMNQIPIVTQLAKHYGVASSSIMKMAQDGKISVADFNATLDENAGKAALAYAETWKGVTANILANLGKLGAKFMEPSFQIVKTEAAAFLELLKSPDFAQAATDIGNAIGKVVSEASARIRELITWWGSLTDSQRALVGQAVAVAITLGPVLKIVGLLVGGVGSLIKVVTVTNAMFVGWQNAAAGAKLSSDALKLATDRQTLAAQFGAVANNIYAGSLTLAEKAAKGLRVAMMFLARHPLLVALTLLTTALTLFFTKTEAGQKVWGQLMAAMQPLLPVFKQIGDVIGQVAGTIGTALGGALEKSSGAVGGFVGKIGPVLATVVGVIADVFSKIGPTIGNVIGVIGRVLGQFGPAIGSVLGTVAGVIGQLFSAFAPLLPMFAETGARIVQAFAPVVETFVNELMPVIGELGATFGQLFADLVAQLAPVVAMFVQVLMPVLADLVGQLAPLAGAILTGFAPVITMLIQELVPVVLEVVKAFAPLITQVLQTLVPIISQVVQAIAPLITNLLTGLMPVVLQIAQQVLPIFIEVFKSIIPLILEIVKAFAPLIATLVETLIPVIKSLLDIVATVFEAIAPVIKGALDVVIAIIQTVISLLKGDWEGVWNGIKDFVAAIWETIKAVIDGAIKIVASVITNTVNAVKAVWEGVWNGISGFLRTVWGAITGWFNGQLTTFKLGFALAIGAVSKVWNDTWNNIKGFFATIWNGIKGTFNTMIGFVTTQPKKAFEGARDAIGKAWAGIQDLARAPVRFVVQTVIGGLIDVVNGFGLKIPKPKLPKGFAGGGILPGTSRMHHGDDQIIQARRGEGVMVSEALRTRADKAAFLSVNAAGRRGVGFASMLQGLARGGLVDPLPRGSWHQSQAWGNAGHNGLDMAAPSGTKVYAAASGIVRLAGPVNMGGNEIYVQHTNGLGTRYSHLSGFATKAGATVRQGQVIGYVGSTGMSTGPHLHYMVHNPGLGPNSYYPNVNPARYLGAQGKEIAAGTGLFDGFIDDAVGQIKKAFPGGGMFVDLAGGLAKTTINGLTKVFTGLFGSDTGSTGAKLYDQGGIIPHGGVGVNLSGKPEAVLTGAETQGYKALMRALSGAGGLGGVGGNVLAGLVAGLRGGRGGVVSAVREITSAIVGTANAELEIHSPSRVFKTIGKYIGAGLNVGITGSVAATRTATERLVNAVVSGFDQLGSERGSLQKKLDRALGNWRSAKAGSKAKANYAAQIADYRRQIAAINAAIGAPGKSKQPALLKSLASQNAQLNSIALQRASVAKKLAAAQKVLADSADQMADWSAGIQDKINGLGGIAGKSSVSSMVANLQKRLDATKQFTNTIAKLKALGLDSGSMQELTEQFAQTGSSKAAEALLASGKSVVKQVVDLRKQLDAAGGKLGDQVGSVLYQAGIDSAKGLIKGLQSQEKALQAQAKKIADTITKTVRKTLGIKSPSRVLMKDGRWSGLGYAKGIDSTLGEVEASARAMVAMPESLAPEFTLSRAVPADRAFSRDDLSTFAGSGAGAGYSGPIVLRVGEREFDGYMGEIADDRISRLRKVTNRARQRANGTR